MKHHGNHHRIKVGAALTLLSIGLTARVGAAPTPDPGDTTPPSIVSVTPASGQTGVAKDANIVVTFSEAMNQASAQSAFQSSELGAGTITWNAGGTVMTVNPNADLTYTSSGKSYSFQITTTATDLKGNALSTPASVTFKTFRQLSATLPIKARHRRRDQQHLRRQFSGAGHLGGRPEQQHLAARLCRV